MVYAVADGASVARVVHAPPVAAWVCTSRLVAGVPPPGFVQPIEIDEPVVPVTVRFVRASGGCVAPGVTTLAVFDHSENPATFSERIR